MANYNTLALIELLGRETWIQRGFIYIPAMIFGSSGGCEDIHVVL